MKDLLKKLLREALILKKDSAKGSLIVVSDSNDAKIASQETFRNKEILKKDGFTWNNDYKAWITPIRNYEMAKSVLDKINNNNQLISKFEDLQEFLQKSEDFAGKGNLMDKITLYVNDLANATDEKVLSAEIRRYLTFFASFRGHSFYNTMLIFIQNPNATKVAGFRQWEEKYSRRVKKGAKGIMIFAPIFNKSAKQVSGDEGDDSGLDKEVNKGNPSTFRPVYVFDIADTEPINDKGIVPERPKWFEESEPTERTQELYKYLSEVADDMGIKITADNARGGEKGFSAGNHINMSSSIQGAGEVSTLVHELAHELMHWKASSLFYQGDEVRSNRAILELQAESVAYIVMKHYNLPVEHQPVYIALWKGNKEKILANLKVISNVAKFIIEAIDNVANRKNVDENLYL